MKDSEILSLRRWRQIKWIAIAMLIISFIGFADAAYLTANHYFGEGITCSVLEGCDEVLTSDYATVGNTGISVSVLGLAYYLTVFLAMVAYVDTKKYFIFKAVAYFTIVGVMASSFLLYLQAFVIEAFCFYCLLSVFTSVFLFIFGIVGLKKRIKNHGQ